MTHTGRGSRRAGLFALSATLAALVLAVPGTASAQQLVPAPRGLPGPSSPDLIDRAQEAGTIDNETANLYRVYALMGDARLPSAYESSAPYDGTLELREARDELRTMDPGPERRAVAAALRAPPDPNVTNCDALSVAPMQNSTETTHFYIQYNDAALESSLDIEDYKQSLETAWLTEVDSFRWAAPPDTALGTQELGGKYHVRIDALGPGLYGFVSPQGTYAGRVGDNPATAWNEGDADASCMGLNQDYTGFPSPPRQSLDSTTAHEFKHSLQFGYGALSGANTPDDHFVEGGATWMEDEAQDGANDNYFYLYPEFDDSMGEHEGDIYAYWLTFRGLTERFGANVPGGSEQVMQDFWEIISRNEAEMLPAMQQALATKGRTLPGTFHDYAIAARLMRPCGGVYFLPYCFEEAAGYSAAPRGIPASNGAATTSTPYSGSIEDNYTINWVDLPATGAYDVTLSTTGGQLRATIACDTASGVAIAAFSATATSGTPTLVDGFNSDSCPGTPVAVITNELQSAGNPAASTARAYTLSAATDSASTSATVPTPPTEEPPDNGPDPAPAGNASPSGSNIPLIDIVDPVLGGLRLSSRRFRAARAGPAIRSSPLGTRVRYSLTEAAAVAVRYERRLTGRRVGGRCSAVTRRNRGRARCFRFVIVGGTARHRGTAGANSFRLTGRIRGRALRLGVYRLRLSARDDAGNVSRVRRSAVFRIVRR